MRGALGAAPSADASPVSDDDFERRIARFAPFERAPHLAIAVSGGADSLALALLADRWACARGGRVTALTVDHGLRADSGAEAAQVGRWLAARGIAHEVIAWTGEKPATGVQAAARAARRELLAGFCRAKRILHLLLAHQADDQAETFVLRLTAESGDLGLSGMSALVELDDVRVLRPLLDVPHLRLEATLRAAAQPWVEDPSNRNPRFARTALRPMPGGTAAALDAAGGFARARRRHEREVAAFLARAAAIFPGGWIELDPELLLAAPEEIAREAVLRAVMTVGGQAYPPRRERLHRLVTALRQGDLSGGRTLGGCRIARRRGRVVVAREPAAVGPDRPITSPGTYFWDGRFALQMAESAPENQEPALRLAALGERVGLARLFPGKPLKEHDIPAMARSVLPALWDLEGVVDVPHLSYRRRRADADSVEVVSAVFRPRHVLAGAGFATP